MKFKHFFYSVFYTFAILGHLSAQSSNSLLNQKAPLFIAKALFADGHVGTFNLADYAGQRVVLYFYPMDNTPGCTKQAQVFRDGIAKLEDQGIVLIGISCDSIEAHKRFQNKHHLPYTLVSDSRLHRSIGKKYPGTVSFGCYKRKTFLINENGIVFKVFEQVNIEHQIDDILKAFAKTDCK